MLRKYDPKAFVLNYVTNHGAQDEIEQILQEFGYKPGLDFIISGLI